MSEIIRPQAEGTVSSNLEAINRDGDAMDRDRRFRWRVGTPPFIASTVAAGFPLLSHEGAASVGWLGSAPVYELGAGAIGAAAYAVSRAVDKKAVAAAEQQQAFIRDTLQEPVDIVRIGGYGKPHKLMLHWHGANSLGSDVDKRDLAERLAAIAQFNEKNNINNTMLGADWLKDVVGEKIGPTDYGDVAYGPDAVMARKYKSSRINATDLESDERVLVAKNHHIRKLLQKLEINEMKEAVSQLMEHVADEAVKRCYDALLAGGTTPERFAAIVRLALEREYDRHIIPGHRKEADEYGARTIRHRVTSSITISNDGHFNEKSLWNNRDTGHAQIGMNGKSSLLRRHGVDTVEQLASKVVMSKNHDESAALSALYLTLIQKESYLLPSGSKERPPETQVQTLFERMAKERLTTFPHLDSLPRIDGEPPSVEYKHRVRKSGRRLLGAAAIMVPMVVGVCMGSNAEWYFERAEKETQTQHADQAKSDPDHLNKEQNYADRLKAAGDSFDDAYVEAYADMKDFDSNLSTYMMDKYMKVLSPALGPFSESWRKKQLIEWRNSTLTAAPPGASALNSGETDIGDVNMKDGETNSVIFSITPLSGKSTEGYWYSDLMADMDVSSGRLKYNRTSREVPQVMGSIQDIPPAEDERIKSRNPDFMVETDYILDGSEAKTPITLPMRQGDTLVGLRIIDSTDPSKIMNMAVERVTTGVEQVVIDDGDIKRMQLLEIEHPKLQYWVKESSSITIQPEHDLSYPENADMKRISQEVRSALQLPVDASDHEVFDKISESKYYSFTPLSDERKSLPKPSDDADKLLTELGTTLAEMDSLNCNLASTLYLLGKRAGMASAPVPTLGMETVLDDTDMNLATGFHDNGDGKLTKRESHAWLINGLGTGLDPTPSTFKNGAIDVSPRDNDTPNKMPLDTRQIPVAMLGAALAVVAWRRREQLRQSMDRKRAASAVGAKAGPEALGAIITAAYGAPGSKMYTVKPNMGSKEIRETVLRTLPVDGYSLREVKRRLAEKGIDKPLPVKTQLAIMALGMHDGAIRRTTEKP